MSLLKLVLQSGSWGKSSFRVENGWFSSSSKLWNRFRIKQGFSQTIRLTDNQVWRFYPVMKFFYLISAQNSLIQFQFP